MADLPQELLHAIAKDVEHDPSIFILRLVSKSLNSAVSPLAFRVIVVHDSVKSAEAVTFLQNCDGSLTSLVREIDFQGEEGRVRDETSGVTRRAALRTVFSRLSRFPNLQSLRLNFNSSWEEEGDTTFNLPTLKPSHFLRLQNEMLATLAASPPPPITSLILNNLIAVPDDIYAQEEFRRLFASLRELEISVISDTEVEGSYMLDPLTTFWEKSVGHMVRGATAATALTIRSDQSVGAGPTLPTIGTFLPHLTSLVLHKCALQSDVVNLILRHKATLTRLELKDCSIDGGENGDYFPDPWHAVFALFRTELSALTNFVFDHAVEEPDEDIFGRNSRFEYTMQDPGWGYMQWDEEIAGGHQDLPALEELMAVVANRVSPNIMS
ncbi:hypothetical protein C8R47DRAFT_477029 [Mycena vitilis]|nr:hypothetical protein C8R47DRAFT_477029 [Mycena vitilis]